MASRRISSSGSCRCLRCRQGRWGSRGIPRSHQRTVVRSQSEKSYQQEMDAVRRELAVLIEDSTLSDLRKQHSTLWEIIEKTMASRRISSSGSCRCLRCRQGRWGSRGIPRSHQRTVVRSQSEKSYQQEMDAVRRELAVLIEDSTLSDLRKQHSTLWEIIEFQNYDASVKLENVKNHEEAGVAIYASTQRMEEMIQLLILMNAELHISTATLNSNISQRKASFPEVKKATLQRCQQSVEEKYQLQIDKMQKHHNSTKLAFDNMRELQAKVTNSRSERERQLEAEHMGRVEIMLEKETEAMQKKKAEWTSVKRSEMEKEQAEYKNSLRQKIESELKENSQREMEMRISEARLACLEEQKLTKQAKIEQILADAKKQWQEEHERDIKQLTRKRQFDESDSFCKDELS